MKGEASIIRTGRGVCWFQTYDESNGLRLSYLGHVGGREGVEFFCQTRGIRFVQMEDGEGGGERARGGKQIGLESGQLGRVTSGLGGVTV